MRTVFHTRQFKAGNSQAVRLPSKVAYPPETELTISRIGEKIIIEPAAETLDGFVDFLCTVGERHDGQRVEMDVPERDQE
ncbi:MAG: AbrB family transcriptional regulator [Zoogloeaceae bacterium]|nr:AbrB family transcriptional regulator [Zoogloeaceae bacterium]